MDHKNPAQQGDQDSQAAADSLRSNSGVRSRPVPGEEGDEHTTASVVPPAAESDPKLREHDAEVEALRQALKHSESERQSLQHALASKDRHLKNLFEEVASLRASSSHPYGTTPSIDSLTPATLRSPSAADVSGVKRSRATPPPLPTHAPASSYASSEFHTIGPLPPLEALDEFVEDFVPKSEPPRQREVTIRIPSETPAATALKQETPLVVRPEPPGGFLSLRHVFFSENKRRSDPPESRKDGQIESSERRSDERRPHETAVAFEYETHFFAGLSQDLSAGGLFIATYVKLPIGTSLSLRFELPDGSQIVASGLVRWLRETDAIEARPGMGVEFDDIAGEDLDKIVAFCNTRPPMLFDT